MYRVAVPCFALVLCFMAATSLAHHSFVGKYDASRIVTVKGVISGVRYGNPHIFFTVDATGGGSWRVEAESIQRTRAKGLTKKHLTKGTAVTVRGWPAKNGAKRMGLQSITVPGGKTIKIRGTAR